MLRNVQCCALMRYVAFYEMQGRLYSEGNDDFWDKMLKFCFLKQFYIILDHKIISFHWSPVLS